MKRSTDALESPPRALPAATAWIGLASRYRRACVLTLVLLGAMLSGIVTTPAQAQIVVMNSNDSGPGSLREAIVTANASPGSIITFSNAVAGQTITLASELPLILGNNTTIDGGSQNITISGANTFRVFFIGSAGQAGEPASTTATIENLTITNANAHGGNGGLLGGGGAGLGGAVFVSSTGALTLSNVSLASNAATGGNGGTGGTNLGSAGGGGGMGGSASPLCCNGGGGGFGNTANGGTPAGGNGSAGAFTGGAPGGASPGAGSGGVNGGGGGGALSPSSAGGGGVGGSPGTSNLVSDNHGGNGGFGGGGGSGVRFTGSGGSGGNGGFGGGGGGGASLSSLPGIGGNGGFGGGGGGGDNGSTNTPGINGNGGFGGGNGGGLSGGGGGGAGLGGALFVQQGGTLTLGSPLVVNGNTVTAGSGLNPGSAFGAGMFLQGNGTVTFQPGAGQTQIFADAIADQTGSGGTGLNAGSWNLILNGAGTLTLSGINSYTGATTIDAGTLTVNGSIASSSGVAINAGGTLNGTGLISAVTINSGGVLMPGMPTSVGTLTGTGNVIFNAGASYQIFITGTNSSKFTTAGGAALNSSASVGILSGSSIVLGNKYTIFTATGGVTGTFDPTVTFGVFRGTLSYDTDDVFLTFGFNRLAPLLPANAPTNVVNAANAIDNFFLGSGTLPGGFQNLFNLTPAQIDNALTQLSGEAATGAQQSSYQLMNDFLGLLTDPATFGNGAGVSSFASARALPPDVALAYASVLKAPRAPTIAGWTLWGSAYGGAGHLDGDAAVIGSHDLSTSAGGFAAGADRLVTPNTRLGFALAGGFTGWGLSDGLGGGHGDAFQAGVYSRTAFGPAYLASALAFAEHWMSTDRFAMGDHLKADFAAQSVAARLEGGYRLPASYAPSGIGVIPYAALQAQRFHTPGYSETDLTGVGFGLTYNAQSSTDTRAELGSRFDKFVPLDNGALLAWRARLAWAHDWVTNPALTATFQALPGASFVVNGAAPRHDSALVTLGPEVRWQSGWSLSAKFDGEFASGEAIYAGTARLRFTW